MGRRPPAPDFRRTPTRRPFHRWSIAAVAYGIQTAAFSGVFFVVALVFLLLAPLIGLAGADISEGSFLAAGIVVIIAIRLFSLTLQVRYIARNGAEQAVLACLTALVAAMIVGSLAGLLGVPSIGLTVVAVVVEISVAALLIRPVQSRTW